MDRGAVCLYTLLLLVGAIGSSLTLSPEAFGEWSKDTNKLREQDLVRDKDHLQEHLGEDMNINVEDMSPEELDFHFFQIHDLDQNGALDGLEMTHALQHSIYHSVDDDVITEPAITAQILKHSTNAVDRILTEDDLDNNGYIDYTEFSQSRRKNMLSNTWKRKKTRV